MMNNISKPIIKLMILLTASAWSTGALACIAITSVPYIISNSGTYCLNDDLEQFGYSAPSIVVQADNVTIDFQGHALRSLDSKGNGIVAYGSYTETSIKIVNGSLQGYLGGIIITDYNNSSVTVANNIIIQDVSIAGRDGIQINNSENIHLSNNHITAMFHGMNINNSQLINILDNSIIAYHGISLSASNADVRNNSITGKGNNGYGILSHKSETLLEGNAIKVDDKSSSVGVHHESSVGLLKNNTIYGPEEPYRFIDSTISDGGGNFPLIP